MPVRTHNASQHVLKKPLICQRGHKIYLNMCWPNTRKLARTEIHRLMCWPNPSHASEDTKYISRCVDYTPSMPEGTQHVFQRPAMPAGALYVSQHILGKITKCQGDANSNTICIEQIPSFQWRHNASQHCWRNRSHDNDYIKYMFSTNPSHAKEIHKMYLNLCWPKTSHACED